MNFVRLIIFGFVVMTVVYVCVSLYSRSVRREKLENEWADRNPDSGDMPERDKFVEAGMAEYHTSLRKRLILLVYIVPTLAVAAIIYLIN